jgi:hypothetical protein
MKMLLEELAVIDLLFDHLSSPTAISLYFFL